MDAFLYVELLYMNVVNSSGINNINEELNQDNFIDSNSVAGSFYSIISWSVEI